MAGAILGFAAAVAVVVVALIGRGPDREPTSTSGGSATTIAPTVLGTVIERSDTTAPTVASTTTAPVESDAAPVATDPPADTDEVPPPTLIPPLVVENPNAP